MASRVPSFGRAILSRNAGCEIQAAAAGWNQVSVLSSEGAAHAYSYPFKPDTSMRSLSKLHRKRGIWETTSNVPQIGPNDLLINVKTTAICGTDVHIYEWDSWSQRTIPTPMITGHEYAGVVAEIGSNVQGFKIGDRVTGEGHLVCGLCRNCRGGRQHLCRETQGVGVNRPGAFAEYMSLPASNAFKLPAEIPDEFASIMDPLGNAVHCALSFDIVGEDVLITGAGPIGIMASAICRHLGARFVVITDVNPVRLELAKQCGCDVALDVSGGDGAAMLRRTMSDLGMTEGFDVGLEMSGNGRAVDNMLKTMNHGGKVAILGIAPEPLPIDMDQLVFKGLTVKGIYGREMYETWYKMRNMLIGGLQKRLEPIITHHYEFNDYEKAFETMCAGKSGKVILHMP